jgi:hypothetical protein
MTQRSLPRERLQRLWRTATTTVQWFVQLPADRMPKEQLARITEATRWASHRLAQQAVFGTAKSSRRGRVERLIGEVW